MKEPTRRSLGPIWVGVIAVAVCCAASGVIAGGVLGVAGVLRRNPIFIALGVLVAAGTLLLASRRGNRG